MDNGDETQTPGCIVRLVPYSVQPEDYTIWERELVEGELSDGLCRFYSTGSCEVGFQRLPNGRTQPIVQNLHIELDAVCISEAALILPHRISEEANVATKAFAAQLEAKQHQITDAAGVPFADRGSNAIGG